MINTTVKERQTPMVKVAVSEPSAKIVKAAEKPTRFGPTFDGKDFPAEMRRQLWPLCCGASIISGFKNAYKLTEAELVAAINDTVNNYIPDFQVFSTEKMRPRLTFLTLNHEQMDSNKIMAAIKQAGFKKFAEAKPRGSPQGFFIKDDSNSFNLVTDD